MTRTRRTSSSVPRGEPAQGRRLRGRCGELCAPSRPHPTQCPHLPASGCARGRRKPAPRCWGSHAGALEPHDLHSLYSAPPPSPHAPPSSKLGLWGILGQSALQLAPPPSLDQSRPPHPLCHSHQSPRPPTVSHRTTRHLAGCPAARACPPVLCPTAAGCPRGPLPPEAMPSSAGDPCRAPPAGKLACAPEHRRRPAGSQRPRCTPSSLCPRAGSDLPATGVYLPKPHNPAPYADLVVGHSKGPTIYGAVNSASAEDGGSERGSCSRRPGPAQAPRDTAVHHCARSRTRQRVVKAT